MIRILLLLVLVPIGLPAQAISDRLRVSVAPETVTVGERFRAAVFVDADSAARVEMRIEADSAGRWQEIGTARAYPPDSANRFHRAVSTVVAWRTETADSTRGSVPDSTRDSDSDSMRAVVRLTASDGATRDVRIAIPLPFVRSVLPADTTKWKPRPAKDVWGLSRDWRMIALLAAAAAVLLAILLFVVLRRRKKRPRKPVARLDARRTALAALERARASGLAEAGDWRAFYSQVSAALRGFAETIDRRWSADLTTTELLGRMREDGVPDGDVGPLAHVLRTADLAKFARHGQTLERAHVDWASAKQWVETFARPARETVESRPAAEMEEAAR